MIKDTLLVFYKCRWCSVIFHKKMAGPACVDASHFLDMVTSKDGVNRFTKDGSAATSRMFEIHECDGKGRGGISDIIGARPAKAFE